MIDCDGTKEGCLIDQGYTLFGFLSVGITELGVKDGDLKVDKRVFL